MTDINPTGTPPDDRPFRHRIANPQSVRLGADRTGTPPGQVSFEEYDRATREALRLVTQERDDALERVASFQHGAGAHVRDAVARATADIARERDTARTLLGEVLDDVEHVVAGNTGYIDRDMLTDYRRRAQLEQP